MYKKNFSYKVNLEFINDLFPESVKVLARVERDFQRYRLTFGATLSRNS